MTHVPFVAEVLTALARERVRFAIVGGVAVNLQGVPRFTADIDLAVSLDPESLGGVTRALTGLGLVPRLPVDSSQLANPDVVRDWIENRNLKAFTFQDPADPLRQVDLLLAPGVPVEEILSSAERITAFGVEAPVASLETLIRLKTGTGRLQDASDIEALKRVRQLRDST